MKSKWTPRRLSLLPATLCIWLAMSIVAAQWVDPVFLILAVGLFVFTSTLALVNLFRGVNWFIAILSILVYGLAQIALKAWSLEIVFPLVVFGIAVLGIALMCGMITRQQRMVFQQFNQDQKLIEELRIYDPVTGLLGFQAALQSLRNEVTRSQRYDKKLCVLLVQIENQSTIEEDLGANGFQALKRQVASVITDSLRAVDIGFANGERIGVLFPETTLEGARVVVNRILERVTRKAQVGLNMGIAQFPTDGVTDTELIRSAEAALQMSQSTGQPFVRFSQVQEVAAKDAL
jgi:diguanylate cyclase (GGDEF)-like protein